MIILVSAKQLPDTGVGVKVYSVVNVLFMAGDQMPLNPLLETVGKGFKTSPTQMELTCIKDGLRIRFTVMVIVVLLAQGFESGVKM